MKISYFMSKLIAQSDSLNITPLKYAIVFRMIILKSFIHISDTNHRDRKSCCKKYGVHQSSDNIGIPNCTTDRVTNILHDPSRLSKKLTRF